MALRQVQCANETGEKLFRLLYLLLWIKDAGQHYSRPAAEGGGGLPLAVCAAVATAAEGLPLTVRAAVVRPLARRVGGHAHGS